MQKENPFVLPLNEYHRDLNILSHYVKDVATYLSIETGRPIDECVDFVKSSLRPDGKHPFKDPEVVYLDRGDNGDRVKKTGTFAGYLADTIQNRELIAPTFTTYLNPEVETSLLVEFIDDNVAKRGVAKKAMFKAKMAGDEETEFFKKTEQSQKKISNNSISGAHVSESTPLVNKTAHSTLTSTCRITSGNGNANNEKLLSGNRHYWNPKIVLNNIISIINNTDYDHLELTMREFGIRNPTVAETMECILYSTNLYFRNEKAIRVIHDLVEKLTPIQRSAFVYTGDLMHIAKYNDAVVMKFITQLSSQIKETCDNPAAVIEEYREEYKVLAMQFFPKELAGVKDLKDVADKPIYQWLACTTRHIHETLMEYKNFIKAFFVTKNTPASLAFFPDSIRRAALTSDTDSTIFTVQDWVFWHRGPNCGFNEFTDATAATMIFLAAETITHVLAGMSANIGIVEKRLKQIAMKNEYKFPVFVPTNVGKHYFAYISCQEGNLYAELEMEIKGVHLKSSNVPKDIMAKAVDMMKKIMDTVMANEKISLLEHLKTIGDIERAISKSILSGEATYFRRGSINDPNSYKQSPEESPYQHHTFWEKVFAPKYGPAPAVPYQCFKVSVDLGSKTAVKNWIDSIKDRELAGRLQEWVTTTDKAGITTFQLPQEVIQSRGLPEEIVQTMDMRKLIFDITFTFYIILEVLGYYCVNKHRTRLVSDVY